MKRLISLFLGMGSLAAFAQPLSGRVTDQQGDGLLGAHVYLLQNWQKGAITDLEGGFTLDLTSADWQDSLVVSFVGFEERVMPVSSASLIQLKELHLEGKTVVVTSSRLVAEEFRVSRIRKLDIYTNPAAKADPLLAVNAHPSATTTDESANISLRGSSALETGIFLNNVPVYDAVRYAQLNGIGTFSIFNTAIIKEVSVFAGNPPLEFGNTTSGVVAISTDETIVEDNTNALTLSLASVGYAREQKIDHKQSLKFFSNWQSSGLFKQVNTEALSDIRSFQSGDVGMYWFGKGEKLGWKVLSYSNLESYDFHFQSPSYTGLFSQSKYRSFLTSSVEMKWGSGLLSLNNGLSLSRGDFAYSNVDFSLDKNDLFAGLNYLWQNEKLSVKGGLSYDRRRVQVQGDFHAYPYALAPDHPTVAVDGTSTIRTLEGFGYLKYYLNQDWVVAAGLRKNIPTDGQTSYLSRQMNLSYRPHRWVFILGMGTYFKNGIQEGDGSVFNASSRQVSLDAIYTGNNLEAGVAMFEKRGDLLAVDYLSRGVETFATLGLGSKIWASASLTWLHAKREDGKLYPYDIDYFMKASLRYKPSVYWTLEGTLSSREGTPFLPVTQSVFHEDLGVYQPLYSEEIAHFSGYVSLGLSVSRVIMVSENLNVICFASVNNLPDHNNERARIYSEDYASYDYSLYTRRTLYFGAMINF